MTQPKLKRVVLADVLSRMPPPSAIIPEIASGRRGKGLPCGATLGDIEMRTRLMSYMSSL